MTSNLVKSDTHVNDEWYGLSFEWHEMYLEKPEPGNVLSPVTTEPVLSSGQKIIQQKIRLAMHLQRFNIFNQIHKALRALLFDTSLMTQRTDYTSRRETELTISRIKEVMFLFDHPS